MYGYQIKLIVFKLIKHPCFRSKLLKNANVMTTSKRTDDQSQITANRFLLYTNIEHDQENILNSNMWEKVVNIKWCFLKYLSIYLNAAMDFELLILNLPYKRRKTSKRQQINWTPFEPMGLKIRQ